jgi:hypothetical protein
MTTLRTTLQTVLERTGAGVWQFEKPLTGTLPAIVYNFISDPQIISHAGDTGNRRARIQLTLGASSAANLDNLVEAVRTQLTANNSDFEVSLPLETRLESKQDNIYQSILEFRIHYKV